MILLFSGFGISYSACSADLSRINSFESETSYILDLDNTSSDETSCVETTSGEITLSEPVDIIFVIDNSGSMTEEIGAITKNINDHFANVMKSGGIDYRVIMLTQHGSLSSYGGNVCIESPLSTIPVGGCENLPYGSLPGNKYGQFYHYSYDVQSNDSACVILDTLLSSNGKEDDFNLAPNGWIKWLRKSSLKVFVEITDDSAGCVWYPKSDKSIKKILNDFQSDLGGQIFALEFDKQLTKLAPEYFGTPENRNYIFYSIVGLKEKPDAVDENLDIIDSNGVIDDCFTPSESIVNNVCSTAMAPGYGYQALSQLTGGLRFPVCQADKFDIIFEKIANSIASITTSVCILNLPENVNIDLSTLGISVETDNGNITLNQVENEYTCSNNSFYVDKASNNVIICDEACLNIKSIAKDIILTGGCIENIH